MIDIFPMSFVIGLFGTYRVLDVIHTVIQKHAQLLKAVNVANSSRP
jgi:hypothetical protein